MKTKIEQLIAEWGVRITFFNLTINKNSKEIEILEKEKLSAYIQRLNNHMYEAEKKICEEAKSDLETLLNFA